jgi:chromosome segregation ATPase
MLVHTFEQELHATNETLVNSKDILTILDKEEEILQSTRNYSLQYMQTISSLAPTTIRSKNGQYLKDVYAAAKEIDSKIYNTDQKIHSTESALSLAKTNLEKSNDELEHLKRQVRNLIEAKPAFAPELDSLVHELSILHTE